VQGAVALQSKQCTAEASHTRSATALQFCSPARECWTRKRSVATPPLQVLPVIVKCTEGEPAASPEAAAVAALGVSQQLASSSPPPESFATVEAFLRWARSYIAVPSSAKMSQHSRPYNCLRGYLADAGQSRRQLPARLNGLVQGAQPVMAAG
jgi:hypothetical protein